MKKRISLTLILIAIACIAVLAMPARVNAAGITASGTCGTNVTWMLDEDGVLTISGSGAMPSYVETETDEGELYVDPLDTPWETYKSSITAVVIGEGISRVGDGAFWGCAAISSVSFPSSCTTIGISSFRECTGLTRVDLPSNLRTIDNEAFFRCTGLTEINLPDSLRTIQSDSFYYCTGLTHVEIPSGMTSITGFECCTGLTTVTLPEGLLYLHGFEGCSSLSSINIPSTVTNITSRAFYNCKALKSVTIPASVTRIGKMAFGQCPLTSLTIRKGDDFRDIIVGAYAFSGNKLSSSYFDESALTYDAWVIGSGDNQNHTSGTLSTATLTIFIVDYDRLTIHVPASRSGMCGANAFWSLSSTGVLTIYGSGDMYDYDSSSPRSPWRDYNTQIKAITIGSAITRIGDYAFYGSSAESFTIQDASLSMGTWSVGNSLNLTSIDFGTGTISPGNNVFEDCEALTTVHIPANVVMNGNGYDDGSGYDMFHSCGNLTTAIVDCAYVGSFFFESDSKLSSVTFTDPDVKFYFLETGGSLSGSGNPFNSISNTTITVVGYMCSDVPKLAEEASNSSFHRLLVFDSIEGDPGHSWGEPTYVWAEDNSSVTATAVCTRDASHVVTETVDTTSEITKEATASEWGETTYTATFSNSPFTVQTKIMTNVEPLEAQYVVVYTDGTMVFQATNAATEDKEISSIYGINDKLNGSDEPAWIEAGANVTSVIFAKDVAPTSTAHWFDGFINLRAIESISKLNTSNVVDMSYMFNDCNALSTLDVSGFDTSNVTDMKGMFFGCNSLTTLDVSGFDTGCVTNMASMFWHCNSLTALDVSGFDTSEVTNMDGMFRYCLSLTALDVHNFDTQRVTNMGGMFNGCSMLTALDVHNFDTRNVTSMANMFWDCNALVSLDISGFDTRNVTSMANMFRNCNALTVIYVSDLFVPASTTSSMFDGCTRLVGGNGTVYDASHTDGEYARIDKADLKGYFTHNSALHVLCHVAAVDPTCTNAGSREYWTCEVCGKIFADEEGSTETTLEVLARPATGHTMVHHPAVEATCDASGNKDYWICSRCGKYFSDENGTIEFEENGWLIPAKGHNYIISYTWEDDYSAVTAEAVCDNDPTHKVEETVTPTFTEVKPATCTESGEGKYTATFENPLFAEQTQTVNIPAVGHSMVHHPAVEATCETTGNTEYWTCRVCGKFFSDAEGNTEIAENVWVVPAKGHSWGTPTYTWSADNSAVTALQVCEHDHNHTHDKTETAEATYDIVTPATCTASGKGVYVAEFTDPFVTQTKNVVIPAMGHTPGEPVEENRVEATCTEDGSYDEVVYCSVCHTEISRVEKTIPAAGHAWGEPTYKWTEDNSKVTASAICTHNGAHTITEPVDTANEITTPATCTVDGVRTYKAEFSNELFDTQTKTEAVAALGHDYGEPQWQWNEDLTSASANFACSRCDHVESVAGEIMDREYVAGVHTTPGYITATALASFHDKDYMDSERVELAAPGHSYGTPAWEWAEDGSSAQLVVKCTECDETIRIDAQVQPTGTPVEPTCTEAGQAKFLAVARYDGTRYTDVHVITYAATGHAWGEPTYKWTEDSSEATASAICTHNGAHTMTEVVQTTNEVTTPATCTADGVRTYTAKFTTELFETQTKMETIAKLGHTSGESVEENRAEATCTEDGSYDEVVYCSICKAEISRVKKTIAATGHSYGEPEWKWSEDFSTATATFTCEHDEAHTLEVTATIKDGSIELGKTVAAQRHADGSQDYTAMIEGPDGKTYEDTAVEILKATHKVHKDKKSKDGKSMAIDVETDTLKAVVTGGVSATAPALVASYDENGRFLGLEVVTKAAEVVEPAENAESIKILWIDSNGYKPQSEAETIERQ